MRPYQQETPNMLWNWNKKTFKHTLASQGARTAKEIIELLNEVVLQNTDKVIEELADVAIMLWALAAGSNIDARPHLPKDVVLENATLLEIVTRLNVTYALYLRHFHSQSHDAGKQLIKTLINLELVAKLLQVDLPEIVDRKMGVNRGRNWEELSPGNYQHVA